MAMQCTLHHLTCRYWLSLCQVHTTNFIGRDQLKEEVVYTDATELQDKHKHTQISVGSFVLDMLSMNEVVSLLHIRQ